jgi:hypothetical protein
MVLFLISNIRISQIIVNMGQFAFPKMIVTSGIAYFIAYGLVIGILYKKE